MNTQSKGQLKKARSKKTIIHVNQHVIKKNRKTGSKDPVLTVKQGKRNRYAMEVEIEGPVKVVYRPDKPLSCGAHVWIETHGRVILHRTKNAERNSNTCNLGSKNPE